MFSTPPDTGLEWLRSHKAKINERAKAFFQYVVDPENPLRTPKIEDCPTPDISADWKDDDEKRVLLLACIVVHQSCGRPMSLGILNRIIQHRTNFESGTEPLSLMQELADSQLITIEADSNEIFRLDSPMLGHYVKIRDEAFALLTGIRFQSDSEGIGFSESPKSAKAVSLPEHLLKLGMMLRQKAKEQTAWSSRASLTTGSDRQQKSIESTASDIAESFNRREILRDWSGPCQMDQVDVQVLAILFTKKVSDDRSFSSDIPSVIGNSLSEKIEVARRLRTGMLRESEVVTVTRMGSFELGDEVLDHLFDLNEPGGEVHENPPLTVFANRFKENSKPRMIEDEDLGDNPFAEVSEN